MAIYQYFQKVKDLSVSREIRKVSNQENSIENMISNCNKKYFDFLTFYEAYSNSENPEIINDIANQLDLLFINENDREGNICFANSKDLRPEFKQSFTVLDLLDYSYAVLNSVTYHKSDKNKGIPFPIHSDFFWQLVQIGSNLRIKENL